MPDQPTGTVTFLFTDVEGSTRLWERNPDGMREALASHDDLLRSTISANKGYVFTTAGDAFSAAFDDPLDAAIAAMSSQQAFAADPSGVSHIDVGWLEKTKADVLPLLDEALDRISEQLDAD